MVLRDLWNNLNHESNLYFWEQDELAMPLLLRCVHCLHETHLRHMYFVVWIHSFHQECF